MGRCLQVSVVLLVIFAFVLQRKIRNDNALAISGHGVKLNEITHSIDASFDFEKINTQGIPPCSRPMVFRDAFTHWGHDCKNDEDKCAAIVKQKIFEFFGNRTVEAWPPSHITSFVNKIVHTTSDQVSAKEFLTNPKYDRWIINSLQQLGTQQEYIDFMPYPVEKVMHMQKYFYYGSQFFFARGKKTGTPMHFAFALNVFALLSGVKRWIFVNHRYFKDANCTVGQIGVVGQCPYESYPANHGNMSIDTYIDVLVNEMHIPKHEIIDITVGPGDIVVNCPLWIHAVENLAGTQIAFSGRYIGFNDQRVGYYWNLPIIAEMVWTCLMTKIYEPSRTTALDLFSYYWTNQTGYLDTDPRFALAGIHNQKSVDGSETGGDRKGARRSKGGYD